MSYRLSALRPFTRWRFRRRVRGGVPDGSSQQQVLTRLGEPQQRQTTDDGYDVWRYDVGESKGLRFRYSVLFDGDRVYSSSWEGMPPDSAEFGAAK